MNKLYLKIRNHLLGEEKTSWSEVLQHSFVNFLFGFTSGIVIAFVSLFISDLTMKNTYLLFGGYFIHKQLESKVLNRNKYTTNLGKNYLFPIPSTIGFVLGAYLSTFI